MKHAKHLLVQYSRMYFRACDMGCGWGGTPSDSFTTVLKDVTCKRCRKTHVFKRKLAEEQEKGGDK